MATILSRIESRIGELVGGDLGLTTVMLQDAYTGGLKAVISPMPKEAWKFFGQSEISFNPTVGTALTLNKIISVVRRDGNVWRKCVEIEQDMFSAAKDVNSIHYRTSFTPAYIIDSGTYSNPVLKVVPEGDGDAARVILVGIPNVDITTDTIVPHFPDDLEELPEIYTVIWAKEREMGLARRDSQDEVEAITSGGILDDLSAMYTGYQAALDLVAPIIIEGSVAIDAGKSELDGVFAGGTDGMFDDFDTAMADVQGNLDSAQDILGMGPSPVTNAVKDLLVAASATDPADTDAVGYLNKTFVEQTRAAIELGRSRVQEAGTVVQSAIGKVSEAQAELQNIDEHFKGVTQYLVVAGGYFKEAEGYLQEAAGWTTQISTKLSEAAMRIQTAQSYDQKSVIADRESQTLQQKFDVRLTAYISQFKEDPRRIFVRDRRRA